MVLPGLLGHPGDTLGTPVDSLLWHLLHPLLFWVLMDHGQQVRMLRKVWFLTSGLRHTFIIRLKSWIPASELRHQSILSNLITVPPPLSAPNCSPRCLQAVFWGLTSAACLTEPFPSGFPVQPVKVSSGDAREGRGGNS